MTAEELGKILDELGRRLGPTGEKVYELAYRQVIIDGVLAIGGFIVLLIAYVVFAVVASKQLRKDNAKQGNAYSTSIWELILPMGMLVGGLGLLFPAWYAFAGLSQLLNPEYAALKDILNSIP